MYCLAVAAVIAETTAPPKDNARSAASAKPSRPLSIFLLDPAISPAQKPSPRFQNDFSSVNKDMDNNRTSERPWFVGQETRPSASLMLGWVPAKDPNTTGPYQPGTYQYLGNKSDADCRAVDKSGGTAVESDDSGGNGLRLPAGWLLGMCLHY